MMLQCVPWTARLSSLRYSVSGKSKLNLTESY